MAKKSYETLLIERKRPHRTRGRFKVVRVPQALLRGAAASTEPFKAVVDLKALAKQAKRDGRLFGLGWFGSAIAALGGGNLIFGPLGFLSSSATPAEFWLAFGSMSGATATGFAGSLLADLHRTRKRAAYGYFSVQALRAWLKGRYALTVSEAELDLARHFLLVDQRTGAEIPFRDEAGKSFALTMGEKGFFVKEMAIPTGLPPQDYAPSGTVAALNPVAAIGGGADAESEPTAELAALLEGDAQALHSRTTMLLTTLAKRALSTERQHVVNRVSADLNQLLVLNRELRELGEVDAEAQAHLAEVLSNLNDELAEVLKAERVAIKKSIATQVDYVKQRRTNLPNLTLETSVASLSVTERFDQHLLALEPEPKLLAAMKAAHDGANPAETPVRKPIKASEKRNP